MTSMEHFEISASEIPSLPFNCSVYPQGQFITGCTDVMIGKGIDGTFMKLFYPTRLGNIKNVPIEKWSHWYLGKKYVKGVGRVKAPFMVPIYVAAINKMIKNFMIPSIWEAPVENSTFPLVIFSHGLLANRNMSCGICSDLASYGFIVAAVEHRDGSACATFTFSPEGQQQWTFNRIIKKNENEFELRKQQVEIRAEECSRVLDIMKKLNFGVEMRNELKNSNFDLQTLKGKLDLSRPIIAGHSFGGATAMVAASKDSRFKFGILLDPWMFPIFERAEQLAKLINSPMLFILMEKFQIEENLKYIKHFQNKNNDFYSLKQGTHTHMTDIVALFSKYPLSFQRILAQCDEAACSPEIIISIINVLIKKFLFKNFSGYDVFSNNCDKFLAKYDSKISKILTGRANEMVGFN